MDVSLDGESMMFLRGLAEGDSAFPKCCLSYRTSIGHISGVHRLFSPLFFNITNAANIAIIVVTVQCMNSRKLQVLSEHK